MNEITVIEQKPQLVIGMRKRGPYQEIPNMLRKLFEYAMAKNIQIVGPPMFVCHEKSKEGSIEANKNKNADVEVAIPVSVKIEETDEIKSYELPGSAMAKIIHKGPYEECEPTYNKLFAWIIENGKTVTGPTRELYLNDPRQVSSEEILTEIYASIG